MADTQTEIPFTPDGGINWKILDSETLIPDVTLKEDESLYDVVGQGDYFVINGPHSVHLLAGGIGEPGDLVRVITEKSKQTYVYRFTPARLIQLLSEVEQGSGGVTTRVKTLIRWGDEQARQHAVKLRFEGAEHYAAEYIRIKGMESPDDQEVEKMGTAQRFVKKMYEIMPEALSQLTLLKPVVQYIAVKPELAEDPSAARMTEHVASETGYGNWVTKYQELLRVVGLGE